MIETVSYHINGLELLTESKPFLSNLRLELNLTAHLGILDGAEVIYVEKMDLYPDPRVYTQIGLRSPAYCSSIGKCLLSCLSGNELDEVLYSCTFEKFTMNTITQADEFKKHLAGVRNQGWAMDNEEYKLGHRCVGAPIFDYRGDSIAAIGVSGSVNHLSDAKLVFVIKEVKTAARDISRRMGYLE